MFEQTFKNIDDLEQERAMGAELVGKPYVGAHLDRKPVKDAAGPNGYPHLEKAEHRAESARFFPVQRRGERYELDQSILRKAFTGQLTSRTTAQILELVNE